MSSILTYLKATRRGRVMYSSRVSKVRYSSCIQPRLITPCQGSSGMFISAGSSPNISLILTGASGVRSRTLVWRLK